MNGRTNSNSIGVADLQIPLDAPSNVLAVAGVNSVTITWTDPKDKYGTTEGEVAQDPQQLVSVWDHSIVVRKVGSEPTGPLDGTQVCSSTSRNQYQTSGFIDMGLDINQTYYYGVFAYNESGVSSNGGFSNCHLWGFDSILENNSWEQISQCSLIGLASSVWEIGDEIGFDLTDNSEHLTFVIMGFNHDKFTNDETRNTITFGLKNCLATKYPINDRTNLGYGGGDINGFTGGSFYRILSNNIYNKLPDDLKSVLQPVTKSVRMDSNNTAIIGSYSMKLFLFTSSEILGIDNTRYNADEGEQYPYFSVLQNRIKYIDDTTKTNWWTMSYEYSYVGGDPYYKYDTYSYIDTTGSLGSNQANTYGGSIGNSYAICFGFCM